MMTPRAPRFRLAVLCLTALGGLACPARPREVCVDIGATANSASTTAAFSARRCQGGGVTWGAVLAKAIEGRGGVSFDDEGDAVRVCGEPTIVDEVVATHRRLNSDGAALQQAMAMTSALFMECAEADGSAPRLPDDMYPVPKAP